MKSQTALLLIRENTKPCSNSTGSQVIDSVRIREQVFGNEHG